MQEAPSSDACVGRPKQHSQQQVLTGCAQRGKHVHKRNVMRQASSMADAHPPFWCVKHVHKEVRLCTKGSERT